MDSSGWNSGHTCTVAGRAVASAAARTRPRRCAAPPLSPLLLALAALAAAALAAPLGAAGAPPARGGDAPVAAATPDELLAAIASGAAAVSVVKPIALPRGWGPARVRRPLVLSSPYGAPLDWCSGGCQARPRAGAQAHTCMRAHARKCARVHAHTCRRHARTHTHGHTQNTRARKRVRSGGDRPPRSAACLGTRPLAPRGGQSPHANKAPRPHRTRRRRACRPRCWPRFS
jgi:hypothetical protein